MTLIRLRRKERDERRELGLEDEDDEYYGLPCDTERPYDE